MENDKNISWYSTVLTQLSDIATKFIGAVKKYGVISSIVAMSLFVGSYTLIVNPIRVD